MRLFLALVVLVACGKSDAERDADRLRDRAAAEMRALKDELGALEKEADVLTKRIDDVDAQLTKLADELEQATDATARAAIEDKLEKLKIEREDVERKLDELRERITK